MISSGQTHNMRRKDGKSIYIEGAGQRCIGAEKLELCIKIHGLKANLFFMVLSSTLFVAVVQCFALW